MAAASQPSLRDQLVRECDAMVRHCLSSGLRLPEDRMAALPESGAPALANAALEIRQLTALHQALAEAVAPAKPGTILLFAEEVARGGWARWLGPVPLVRHMMFASLLSLAAVVGLSLLKDVNAENLAKVFFEDSGLRLLSVELFLLAAASLGASFAALFEVNRYVTEGTFDPKYVPSYWARFVLGLIAGLMLAELIPLDTGFISNVLAASGTESPPGTAGRAHEIPQLVKVARPLLAMLGGFSAAVVYAVLRRLVSAVESLVRGDPRDAIAAEQQAMAAQSQQRASEIRAELGANVLAVQHQILQGLSPEEVQRVLGDLAGKLLPGAGDSVAPPSDHS